MNSQTQCEEFKMRTQDEIVAELRKADGELSDFFGTKSSDALEFLDFEHAKEFLKPEATAQEWESVVKPITRDAIVKKISDYMAFAFEKANNCRGLSANRSISHMEGWLWILGDEDLRREFDSIEYEHYGKEKLIFLCEHFGIDFKSLDNGIRTNGE